MQALDPNGALLHKNLVITAPDGTHRHEIASDQLLAFYPTADPTRAIVETIKPAVYIFAATSADLLPVNIPTEAATSLIVLATSPHWALLGTSNGPATYLVNLESGAVSPLPALADQDLAHPLGLIAPDERSAVLVASGSLWLIPLAHPAQRHQLTHDALVFNVAYADDSSQIVYTATGMTSGDWTLVVVQVNTAKPTTVESNQGASFGAFVPGSHGQQLIVQQPGGVAEVTLASPHEQPLLHTDPEDVPAGVWFSPSGKHVVLRTVTPQSGTGGNRWTWLDLASGQAKSLASLNDLYIPEMGTNRRWVLATTISASNPNNAGAPMESLDTETGAVHLLFKADANTIYVASGAHQPQTMDGRYRFVVKIPTNSATQQLLLIDAATGTLRNVASGVQLGAAFSPDGRWLAVSTIAKLDRNSPVQSRLVAVDGGAIKPLAGGFVMGWLAASTEP